MGTPPRVAVGVPLVAWLVGTLPPVVVGVPALADAPGREESPLLIGAAPIAVLDDVAPFWLGDVAVQPATTAMTTAAQTPRRANDQ